MIASIRTVCAILLFSLICSACQTSSQLVASTHDSDFPNGQNGNSEMAMLEKDLMPISRTIRQDLENYFQEFSELALTEHEKRQRHIDYGMKYFQDDDTPVLIVVNQMESKKIYDEPTTIVNYLDYLKYTRKNPHTINNFELNDNGKISKLELIVKTLY